jgi:hypothetical protein
MKKPSSRPLILATLSLLPILLIGGGYDPLEESEGNARRLAMETIRADDLQQLVDHLASDEMQGRSFNSPEAHEASKFIAKQFEAAGLAPLGDEASWFQAIGIEEAAPNVVGIHRGTGERFLLITAHFDHLPPARKGEDRIYNGADDNASGTSAIIEIARAFAELDEPFEASIVFVAFNAEERGLVGSRHFARNPPLDLKNAIGIINLDMVSRGEENLLFCEGGDSAPDMLASIKKANETIGLDLKFDVHPEWMRQSDQWSLLREGVPALYFGVEDHVDYHKVTDHPDKILPKLIERAARLTFLAATDLASDPKDPMHNPPKGSGLRRIKKGGQGSR